MNIHEVDHPENFDRPPVDWDDVFAPITVKCIPTHKTLKDFLPADDGRRFHDMGDFDEDHRAEIAADDEMKHREAPSDEEIDAMYEASQTEHEAYDLAH